jgi:hypothetical protein
MVFTSMDFTYRTALIFFNSVLTKKLGMNSSFLKNILYFLKN